MYWVGFVFGLGFDTATEVGLLAITAVTSAQDSWVFAPLFALLFTSAMTMIDTFDGLLVRWAIDKITMERQLFFNISVTALATMLALVAAIMQAMSLIVATYPDDASEDTPFISFWRNLPSEYVGMVFMGIFVVGVLILIVNDRFRVKKNGVVFRA
jgi:high-affinity nickel-transport protein